jgi:hypothetical protein
MPVIAFWRTTSAGAALWQVAEKASNLKLEVKKLEVKSEEHGQE